MNPPLTFVAIAFRVSNFKFGGIGLEFSGYYTTAQLSSRGRISTGCFAREKEEAAGGSGWGAGRKKKSEFLPEAPSGNSRVLDCMRRDWQRQVASTPQPDLVCTLVTGTSAAHSPGPGTGTHAGRH